MNFINPRATRSFFVVASALILLAGSATVALAQGGGGQRGGGRGGERGNGGGGGMLRGLMGGQAGQMPALREADLQSAIDTALEANALSKEQQEAVTSLFRSLSEQRDASENKMREATRAAMEKFREDRDQAAFDTVRTLREANQREQQTLEATLMQDIKSVLTPEQQQSWDRIEAGANRSRSLRRGMLSAERLSLRDVVRETVPSEGVSVELRDALVEYETQLDSALRVRDSLLAGNTEIGEAVRAGDIEKATKLLEEREAASRKVKELNERFSGQLRALVPEGKREAFDGAVERESYPDAFRRSGMQGALDTALDLHDLSDDQSTQLAGIVERFDSRYVALRTKAIAARKDAEANLKVADLVARFAGGDRGQRGGGDRLEAIESLAEERRTLDRELREELTKVLNEEQAKIVIPQRGEGGEGRRGRMNPPM